MISFFYNIITQALPPDPAVLQPQEGKVLVFSQDDYRQSQTACKKRFEDLYKPIHIKVTRTPGYTLQEFTKDVQMLEQQFMSEAVGPAKSDVYAHCKNTHIKPDEDRLRSKQQEALRSKLRKMDLELGQARKYQDQAKKEVARLHKGTNNYCVRFVYHIKINILTELLQNVRTSSREMKNLSMKLQL